MRVDAAEHEVRHVRRENGNPAPFVQSQIFDRDVARALKRDHLGRAAAGRLQLGQSLALERAAAADIRAAAAVAQNEGVHKGSVSKVLVQLVDHGLRRVPVRRRDQFRALAHVQPRVVRQHDRARHKRPRHQPSLTAQEERARDRTRRLKARTPLLLLVPR